MTIFCHVSNGLVDNRAVFDGDLPEDWPDRENWFATDEAQIGWRYADEEFAAPPPPPPPDPTGADVNAERNRRIVAGKTINGVAVTGRDEDARNLTNLALAAQLRIGSGDTTTTTTFRDGNNVDHDLTPAEMLALWQGSAAYVSALYAASWAIKAMDPLPADITDDALWPASATEGI
jgi:hypothetical protein